MVSNESHPVLIPVFLLVASLAVFGFEAAARAQGGEAARVDKEKRPVFSLKAFPAISFSPTRVSLVGELKGGANDYEDFYCVTVEWDWGDGTKSEASTDCEPYEAGKSEIKRRFAMQHLFQTAGNYRVQITLKRRNKMVTAANTTVQVRPGVRDLSGPY